MTDPTPPKLIIDTDWKAAAQAEREKLAAAEKAKADKAKADKEALAAARGSDPLAGEPAEGEMPKADFIEITRMLASQTLLYLGAMPDPETGKRMVSLEMAQFHIDMLGVLEDKTKGNLTPQEQTFLTKILYELRMQYVEIGKAVAKAIEQGKISPMGGQIGGQMGGPMSGQMGVMPPPGRGPLG